MNQLAEANEFWQTAKGWEWHPADDPNKATEVRRHYRTLYERAVKILGRVPERIVDWGCGGGLAAQQMMAEGTRYYGVDIVQTVLDACESAVEDMPGVFVPMLAKIEDPESCFHRINHCDLFVCLAVYQHFPDKAYAERITRLAASTIKPDGLAIIQTRALKKKRDEPTGAYKARWMISVMLTDAEFCDMAEAAGFKRPSYKAGTDWASGYYYYFCERAL